MVVKYKVECHGQYKPMMCDSEKVGYQHCHRPSGLYVRHADYEALEQKLEEALRYGRAADITIDNLLLPETPDTLDFMAEDDK